MNQGETQTHWYLEALKPSRLLICVLPIFIGFILIISFHPFSSLLNAIAVGAWVAAVNIGYDRFERKRKKTH